jgi:hypothetical protein
VRRAWFYALDADVHIAFAFGQVCDLVCSIDHLCRHDLRLTIVGDMKDGLHTHGASTRRRV